LEIGQLLFYMVYTWASHGGFMGDAGTCKKEVELADWPAWWKLGEVRFSSYIVLSE
jgi:hypothetical protein